MRDEVGKLYDKIDNHYNRLDDKIERLTNQVSANLKEVERRSSPGKWFMGTCGVFAVFAMGLVGYIRAVELNAAQDHPVSHEMLLQIKDEPRRKPIRG